MRITTWAELLSIEKSGDKDKKKKHSIAMNHRPDAKWLTLEICNDYHNRAKEFGDVGDTGSKRALREDLQKKCDLLEIEAINILNGYHFAHYVKKYDIMQGKGEAGFEMNEDDRRFLNRLAELEEAECRKKLVDEDI